MVLRALIVVTALAVGLFFLPWQSLVPLFLVGYGGYLFWLYSNRIGSYTDRVEELSWGGTVTVLGLSLAAVVAIGVGLTTVLSGFWPSNVFSTPTLVVEPDLLNRPNQFEQTVADGALFAVVLTVELVAIVLLSLGVRWYRRWLRTGVDSREAAVRATLWELPARGPLYLLWALVVGVGIVYTAHTVAFLGGVVNTSLDLTSLFGPLYVDVLPVVIVAGHVAPVVTVGAYFLTTLQYDRETLPEPLGYRGLYPPDDTFSIPNLVVPAGLYLLYAVPVLLFSRRLVSTLALVVLPVLVAAAAAADPLGSTTRAKETVAGKVPGIGGDAVVTGLSVGAYLLVPFALLGVVLNGSLDFIPDSFLLYPVFAVPLAYGSNRVFGFTKLFAIRNLVDEDDPGRVSDGRVDRLLAYATVRDGRLRSTALEGLAVAAGRSTYRRRELLAAFQRAVDREDEAFAAPGLRGLVQVLRSEMAGGDGEIPTGSALASVERRLNDDDPRIRRLATEAFARLVAIGYRRGDAAPLGDVSKVPVEQLEGIVGYESGDTNLRSAVATCFAYLWYHRDRLGDRLDDEDEDRLLVDLFQWADDVDEDARATTVFAVVTDTSTVDRDGLATVVDALDSDHGAVRFMAAHVLRSSMDDVARDVEPTVLLGLLDDEFEPVSRAAGSVIHEFVSAAPDRWEAVVPELLSHLRETDPETAGVAQAATLRTLTALDAATLAEHRELAESVADYVSVTDEALAEPAAELLATFLSHNPDVRGEGTITAAIESGLTHKSERVREHSLDAAAAIVADEPGDGRPFVKGLVLTLGTTGEMSAKAASCLSRILEEYPGYGTEVLPEMVGGLRNPTRISEQYAGAMVVGMNVSEVTASVLADVTDQDVSRGENLVEPLVDLAGSTGTGTLEAVFRALENLSAAYPEAAEPAVATATGALDQGNVRIRRSAAQVLVNVARENPEAVEPVLSKLMIAIDDDDPRTRATALAAIGLVAAASPDAVGSEVRRIIGRLDDDASVVRERAAEVLVAVAEADPEVVEQTAEASDRLRRLQRDPAVDVAADTLQAAAGAIQSGVPSAGGSDEGVEAEADTDLYTVEDVDEVGSSGDTKVFDSFSDGEEDHLDEDICPSCWSDLSDDDDLESCPNCGEALN